MNLKKSLASSIFAKSLMFKNCEIFNYIMKEEQTKNTLLVIEDSPAQLTIYSRALESLDVEILKAKNGEEAISIINSEDLTLVICDLYLPDMTAYGILEYTYKKKGLKSLPFVIMTGKYTEEDLKKLLDLGANDFLRKPFSVVEFLARIKTQLRLKNAFNEEKKIKRNAYTLKFQA